MQQHPGLSSAALPEPAPVHNPAPGLEPARSPQRAGLDPSGLEYVVCQELAEGFEAAFLPESAMEPATSKQ